MIPPYPELDRRLGALRDAAQEWSPPAATDQAIAAAIARAARGGTPRRRAAPAGGQWLAWPLALAASIALLSFLVRSIPPHGPVADSTPPLSAAVPNAFTPVVPVAQIREVPDALVVPARVPRMTLAQFGLPVDPARADDAVDAELLVRRDGALLAYRFVD